MSDLYLYEAFYDSPYKFADPYGKQPEQVFVDAALYWEQQKILEARSKQIVSILDAIQERFVKEGYFTLDTEKMKRAVLEARSIESLSTEKYSGDSYYSPFLDELGIKDLDSFTDTDIEKIRTYGQVYDPDKLALGQNEITYAFKVIEEVGHATFYKAGFDSTVDEDLFLRRQGFLGTVMYAIFAIQNVMRSMNIKEEERFLCKRLKEADEAIQVVEKMEQTLMYSPQFEYTVHTARGEGGEKQTFENFGEKFSKMQTILGFKQTLREVFNKKISENIRNQFK